LNAGPIWFSIRATSEPAYSTFTGPDPVGAAAAEELVDALADVLVVALADAEDDELLDELHAAAVSPRNAIPMTTAAGRRAERKVGILRR
jgi:hypothetical protein